MLFYTQYYIVRAVDIFAELINTLKYEAYISFLGLLPLFMKIIGGILIVVIVLAVLVVLRMRYGVKCI